MTETSTVATVNTVEDFRFGLGRQAASGRGAEDRR